MNAKPKSIVYLELILELFNLTIFWETLDNMELQISLLCFYMIIQKKSSSF